MQNLKNILHNIHKRCILNHGQKKEKLINLYL